MCGAVAADGIDLDAVSRWLTDQGHISEPITEATVLAGGTQNLLLHFRAGNCAYVLRKPPASGGGRSQETVRREVTVLRALADTAVPHPACLAACEDPDVGGPFFVMEAIVGCNITEGVPLALAEPNHQHELALSVIDGAAELALVDPFSRGLGSLSRHLDGWVDKQLTRWRKQLASYREIDGVGIERLPGTESIDGWLQAHRPADARLGLLHGDLHIGNVLFDETRPRVAAIVDWELASIGDPLLDLGHLLVTWPHSGPGCIEVPGGDHLPGREDLLDHYARRTGRDLGDILWFEVLAAYRLAIILEGSKARANAGLAGEDVGERLHSLAVSLMHRARTRSSQD